MPINTIKSELRKLANKEKAEFFPRFFKTGSGQYGEGDKFIGVTVPNCRSIAKKYKDLNYSHIKILLSSEIHEERLVALLILVQQFQNGNDLNKKVIFDFYLSNTERINNWDLVDLSAPKIVGEYLLSDSHSATSFKGQSLQGTTTLQELPHKSVKILDKLAKSENLWERRIAIVSTFAFIRAGKLEPTLRIAKMLLNDKHDLIHKAIGWMLREAGKKDNKTLEMFLKANYPKIPRTTLRYAIERFPEQKRKNYLIGILK